MSLIFNLLFLTLLLIIFYQDIKHRKVTFLFFILSIVIGGYIHFTHTILQIFIANIGINFLILLSIGFILFLYAKFKLKKSLFQTIGIGDFLFFLILAISFSIFSFLILFSTSLIFSLVLFLLLKPKLKHKTVPLAGFQALFLSIILVVNSVFKIVNLYAY